MDESRKMLGTLAFYPTLAYNLLRNYVQPSKWQWYSRVDENLILGALPFKSMVTGLKVCFLISIFDYHVYTLITSFFLGWKCWWSCLLHRRVRDKGRLHWNGSRWMARGRDFVPSCTDARLHRCVLYLFVLIVWSISIFLGSTSRENLHGAVIFIDKLARQGKTAYVHCKAGRTRSATVALCYLMFKHDYSPENALDSIRRERHQVLLRSNHWNSVNDYREFLNEQKPKKEEGS